jgi:hypothetical protein
MPAKRIIALLKGGDRRSIGHADKVASLVSKDPALFRELIKGLWSDDPVVRMRAADAAEKVSRANPKLLQTHKRELIGLMSEAIQQELRWHLAAMAPRLELKPNERSSVQELLKSYLSDRSSIVKAFALQALADLAIKHASFRSEAIEILRAFARTGTPAMKARIRKLLPKLERTEDRSGLAD